MFYNVYDKRTPKLTMIFWRSLSKCNIQFSILASKFVDFSLSDRGSVSERLVLLEDGGRMAVIVGFAVSIMLYFEGDNKIQNSLKVQQSQTA